MLAKDPDGKQMHWRMTVLELAERLGNTTGPADAAGVDGNRLYGWKRRVQTHGLDGLMDLPPITV